MRIAIPSGPVTGRAGGRALVGGLAILSLLTVACHFGRGAQGSPAVQPPAAAPPEIAALQVFENIYSERQTDFPLGSSVAVCFAIMPRESRRPLTLVLSGGSEPPRGAFGAGVIGRSASIPQKEGAGCHVVRIVRAPDRVSEPRAYTVWVLHGSDALAHARFQSVVDGAAGGTAASSPSQAPSVAAGGPDRAREYALPGVGAELRATLVEQPTPSPARPRPDSP